MGLRHDGWSGAFSLPDGSYTLFVQPDEPGYADQWKGGPTFASATPVALSANTTGVPLPLVGP